MAPRGTRTAFVGGCLIDGTGSPPEPDSAVVVEDGRIAWVGRASDLVPEPEARVVDLTGKYVVPGLMDANVHLLFYCEPEVLLRYDPGCYDELVLEAAQVALTAGITTVFDTWGPLESLRRVRDRIDAGDATGSRIYFAGNIIGNGGPWSADFWAGYGELLNPAVVESVNRHWEQGVGAQLTWMCADDVRRVVREYIEVSGIDFVKYASSAHGARKKFLALGPDVQRAIVEEAHAAGMIVQACAMTPEALKLAIEAGVDFLQHADMTGLHPMPRETLELIAARRLPCVALLMTDRHIGALGEHVLSSPMGSPGSFSDFWLVTDRNDRALIEAGAKLMLASDGGVFGPTASTSRLWNPYLATPDFPRHLGEAHILWLRAALERDMPPMDALLSATRNIAEAYGRLDELGTLEPGKRADLLVLDGDPLADAESYRRIAHVVKDGEIVDRARLPEHPVLTLDS